MALTTTQHSAYSDLHRFGMLFPPGPRQTCQRGTSTGYSKRTLHALVAANLATWAPARDGVWPHIVPAEHPAETWADARGVWSVRVAVSPNSERVARAAIVHELEIRGDWPPPDPDGPDHDGDFDWQPDPLDLTIDPDAPPIPGTVVYRETWAG